MNELISHVINKAGRRDEFKIPALKNCRFRVWSFRPVDTLHQFNVCGTDEQEQDQDLDVFIIAHWRKLQKVQVNFTEFSPCGSDAA